ncbi:hypothetical protein H0H81_008734 [Sphagnurus paluster]|uniref:Uncharacterized protein n=1 Tax=Sphagnurus paluster TaxID=117069 RepID=A0A9P7FPS4_9AGAR|nr:hypothetical protein H0H81_008734 [Sphagnurus paluster]
MISIASCLCALLFARFAATAPAPAGTSVGSAAAATPTVPYIDLNPNFPLWSEDTKEIVSPIRGPLGAAIQGPDNQPIDKQNPDLFAPPTTDHGSVANAKWPFALSHNRLHTGGWARNQNGMAPKYNRSGMD